MSTATSYSIRTDRPFSFAAVVVAFAATAMLVVAAITWNVNWALATLPAWGLAAGMWLSRSRAVVGELTDRELRCDEPVMTVPLDRIHRITLAGQIQDPDGNLKRGEVLISHLDGHLAIPDVPADAARACYRALADRLTTSGSRQVASKLAARLQHDEQLFGADKVYTFCRRSVLGKDPPRPRWRTCSAMLLVAGVVWIGAGIVLEQQQNRIGSTWIGMGVSLSLFATVAWAASFATQRQAPTKLFNSGPASLIVSPWGIALSQGDLVGELRWEELRNIRFGYTTPFFDHHLYVVRSPGLHVFVDGATIPIADIYDRPLAVIGRIMQRYWRPQGVAKTQ